MKRFANLTLYFLCGFLLLWGGRPVLAASIGDQFTERVNAARMNPAAALVAAGVDVESLLVSSPWLVPVINRSLAPVTQSAALNVLASLKSRRIAAGEMSIVSDSAELAGQLGFLGMSPARFEEKTAVVGFLNFLSEADAVSLLFERMLVQEVSAENAGRLRILNPEYGKMGIGLTQGRVPGVGNAYFLTCEYISDVSRNGSLMTVFVNQARKRPAAVASALGIEVDPIMTVSELPPLAVFPLFSGSCDAWTERMIETCISTSVDEGLTLLDLVYGAGFEGAVDRVNTKTDVLPTCVCEDVDGLQWQLFRRFFMNALDSGDAGDVGILSVDATLFGYGAATGMCESLAGICGDEVVAGAAVISAGPVSGSNVSGIVYIDVNGDGVAGPGEGVTGACVKAISAVDGRVASLTCTDRVGRWEAWLPDGYYSVDVDSVDLNTTEETVFVDDGIPVWAESVVFVSAISEVLTDF